MDSVEEYKNKNTRQQSKINKSKWTEQKKKLRN